MTKRRLVINGRFLTQPVTGVQRVGIEFCRALDGLLASGEVAGFEVEVVVPAASPLVTDPALRKIAVRKVGRLSGHLWEQVELPWFSRGAMLLALGNTAPIWSLVAAAPRTSVMVHDLSYRYFPAAYSFSFRALYSALIPAVLWRAARIFTVSQAERAAILREYPALPRPERLLSVQNGTPPTVAGSLPGRAPRARNCLYVGSLTKRKNAEGLVEAAIRLARDHGATFTFVGANGPTFEGISVEVPADVVGRVRFLGQINDAAALAKEYDSAAAFVFPSFYEASPLPPTEAMARGCPVVASDIPSLRERCGDAASYCDPSDVGSIVLATAQLLDNVAKWEWLRAEGLRMADTYSWQRQAIGIVRALESSLS